MVLIILTLIIPINITLSSGESWLTNFDYRKEITITGSIDEDLTNYQLGFKLYYGSGVDGTESVDGQTMGKIYLNSHSQIDFEDIRFTINDGETELDYWIQEYTASTTAIFWVEIDSIPDDPDITTIYIYYGSSTVSTSSNGDNTFLFFDDFSYVGSAFDNGWTLLSRSDATQTFTADGTRGILYTGAVKHIRSRDGFSTSGGVAVDVRVYKYTSYATDLQYYSLCGLNRVTDALNGYQTPMGTATKDGLCRDMNGWGTIYTSNMRLLINTWYLSSWRVFGSQTIEMYVNGVSKGSASDSSHLSGYNGVEAHSSNVYLNDYRVRKYTSNSPVFSLVGSEETTGEDREDFLFYPIFFYTIITIFMVTVGITLKNNR